MNFPLSGCLTVAAALLAGCASSQMVMDLPFTPPPDRNSVPFLVRLEAADVDRAAEVVTFKVPPGLLRDRLALWDAWGTRELLPMQIDADGNATVFIPFQKAGQELDYTFTRSPSVVPAPTYSDTADNGLPKPRFEFVPVDKTPAVMVAKEDGRLRLEVKGRPVFYYQMALAKPPRDDVAQKIWRGAFIYPIYTPDGVQVSDTYPVDHPHDHGIWTAWASSYFQGRHVDFWNPHYAYGGTVEFVALDKTWEGSVDGGFESRHRSMDRTVTPPVDALDEQWKVTLYAAPDVPARVFDLEFFQTPATTDPLEVQQYTYGGLGVRGSAQWESKSNLWELNSEGITDRVAINSQPARWFFMGGNIDGAPAGIAVLSAPTNFRSPQTVRMNPDGPFFMYAPVITSGFTISKEQPYRARYRFIVQDGKPDAKFLEACWQGFANPAKVTVVAH